MSFNFTLHECLCYLLTAEIERPTGVIGITPIYRLGNIGNIPEILVKNIQQQTFEFQYLIVLKIA